MLEARIKKIFHNRSIRKEVESRKSIEGSTSNKVLIIIDNEDIEKFSGIIKLHEGLPLNKDEVEVICCNSAPNLLQNFQVHNCNSSDINYKGAIKSELLERLLSETYEFAVAYYGPDSIIGPLLTSKVKAQIKLGKSPDVFSIFDIEIKCDDAQVFEDEIKKYIKIIKKF